MKWKIKTSLGHLGGRTLNFCRDYYVILTLRNGVLLEFSTLFNSKIHRVTSLMSDIRIVDWILIQNKQTNGKIRPRHSPAEISLRNVTTQHPQSYGSFNRWLPGFKNGKFNFVSLAHLDRNSISVSKTIIFSKPPDWRIVFVGLT